MVSVEPDPPWGGTMTGDGPYQPGERVTLRATPNDGYEFHGWFDYDLFEFVSIRDSYGFFRRYL